MSVDQFQKNRTECSGTGGRNTPERVDGFTGIRNILQKQEKAREGIFALIHYHLRWVEKNPNWSRFLIQKRHAEFMGATADGFSSLNKVFMKGCSDWFGRHIESGTFRPLPKELFISILLGPCQEYSRLLVSGVITKPGVKKAAEELGLAAWRALCINSQQP